MVFALTLTLEELTLVAAGTSVRRVGEVPPLAEPEITIGVFYSAVGFGEAVCCVGFTGS